jgi:hypothetical protein
MLIGCGASPPIRASDSPSRFWLSGIPIAKDIINDEFLRLEMLEWRKDYKAYVSDVQRGSFSHEGGCI